VLAKEVIFARTAKKGTIRTMASAATEGTQSLSSLEGRGEKVIRFGIKEKEDADQILPNQKK